MQWDKRQPARTWSREHGSWRIYGVESRYQTTTGEDIEDWEVLVRAVVNCRVCELAIELLFLVVTICKCSINPITDQILSVVTHTRDNMQEFGTYGVFKGTVHAFTCTGWGKLSESPSPYWNRIPLQYKSKIYCYTNLDIKLNKTKYNYIYLIKDDNVGGSCSTQARKCTKMGQKIWREEIT
jgi:hypothetical protein